MVSMSLIAFFTMVSMSLIAFSSWLFVVSLNSWSSVESLILFHFHWRSLISLMLATVVLATVFLATVFLATVVLTTMILLLVVLSAFLSVTASITVSESHVMEPLAEEGLWFIILIILLIL